MSLRTSKEDESRWKREGPRKEAEHSLGMGDDHFSSENGHRSFRHTMSNFKVFSMLLHCNCSPDFINPQPSI